jgi:hypothetical protein
MRGGSLSRTAPREGYHPVCTSAVLRARKTGETLGDAAGATVPEGILDDVGAASPLSYSVRIPLQSEATTERQGCAGCEAVLRVLLQDQAEAEPGAARPRRGDAQHLLLSDS